MNSLWNTDTKRPIDKSVPDLSVFKLPITYLDKKHPLPHSLNQDLELSTTTPTNEEHERKPMYDILLTPSNAFSQKILPFWSEYFTSDTDFLKDTQKIIKQTNAPNSFSGKPLNTDSVIETWNMFKRDNHFLETYSFIEWKAFAELNKSSTFLQLLSVLHITSPVLSLLIPILFMIFPFILLKIQRVPITFSNYINILKNIAKYHFIGKSIQQMSSFSFDKLFYFFITLGLYLLQIYQNIDSCLRFQRNIKRMHLALTNMNGFITGSIQNMTSFVASAKQYTTYQPFCKDIEGHAATLTKLRTMLSNLPPLENLFVQVSQNGYRLRCMYEIYENKQLEQSLLYAMGFNGYMDHLYNINTQITKQALSFASFTKKSTKFVKQFYPPHHGEERVTNNGDLEKNIVISSPNKSGKTTFLKTTTLNILFSQQFGCGFYKNAHINPYTHIHTYLNIPDTSSRDSLFQAESRRCKEMIDVITTHLPEDNYRHFCVFDELYSGTNPEEATKAGLAFIDYLAGFPHVEFILTTHYFKICSTIKKHPCVQNYKMDVLVDEKGEFNYTYKLKKGISRLKGGIRVLRDLQYPEEILQRLK